MLPVEGLAGGHEAEAKAAVLQAKPTAEPVLVTADNERSESDGEAAPVKPAK